MFDELLERLFDRNHLHLSFVVGPAREMAEPAKPSWEHYKWPIDGEVMANFRITDSQQQLLAPQWKDRRGNVVSNPQFDVPPTWATDNPNILVLTPSADGLACTAGSTGMLGTANVQMNATMKGGHVIIGTAAGEVVVGDATEVELQVVGDPTEESDAEPSTTTVT